MQKLNWQYKTSLEKVGLKIVKLLQSQGFAAFWVGGVVRDKLLGLRFTVTLPVKESVLRQTSDDTRGDNVKLSTNIDIATDATPDQIEKILNQAKIKVKPIGKQFGSILAIVNNWPIEITTFRAEGRYSDKRHPDQVTYIRTYIRDAERRDFTINALYFDPIKKQLFDPVGGLKDLKLKLLKFVGDPKKRIDEDALRMFRAVRFATELHFKLEKNSFAAIKTRAKYIQGVSGERIKAELDKILFSKNRADGIMLLDKVGLLKFIIPEFEPLKSFSHQSKNYHLEGSQFEHTLLVLKKIKESNLDLLYAILFHDIGKPQKAQKVLKKEGWVISTKGHADAGADIFLQFAKRLKFPKSNRDTIEWLIRNHMLMFDYLHMRPIKQIRLAEHPAFDLLMRHWHYDEAGTKRSKYADDHQRRYLRSRAIGLQLLDQLKQKQNLIKKLSSGELIMKYSNLKPGPSLGQKIEEVKVQIVLGKIKNGQELKYYLME
ncbi:MAG: hypothetical protein A3B10_01055 [Candidatus Doudnabacteria bacterium RIFCSPLOWO2_01_FULL_44_21]|uniref:HD domain-containing protein n=1 Tax=Candidatus Doudnabacteria bacterium RIFCSPLOWO2_01_FULL_44_21 TaxID=1817841 RepID=A0A1F5PWP9_9BACT|nr:MAG: hypothetical protein A3B95_03965 [Candidatus Doudnabacteria bacterium RIFCSPHIGHO2_02_FULL_43_13b]OGE94376.1 MAG: hypothetical protein A3B10_01055 [Candidatus Doudnabacteria bacterium RIFCSPLOWO2_01_FULL_44_21]